MTPCKVLSPIPEIGGGHEPQLTEAFSPPARDSCLCGQSLSTCAPLRSPALPLSRPPRPQHAQSAPPLALLLSAAAFHPAGLGAAGAS